MIPHELRVVLRWFFGVIAVFYLGTFGYLTARRLIYQKTAAEAFDEEAFNPDTATPHIHRGGFGKITVPRLDLSAVINEGTDDDTLSIAVGHVPGTALPGARGNIALAGHRDTFFHGLKDIQPNDEIDLTTLRGSYRYKVKSFKIVQPTDVEPLRRTDSDVLTLITCYPFDYFGHAPLRFVVEAREVSALRTR
jgi:sortase A